MIGHLIGAGLNVASSIFGGIKSAKARRQADRLVEEQKQKNQAWYEKNYNEPYTQRADVQELLEKTREYLDTRSNRAAATNTVMGGTDEQLAMEKENANKALSETIADINAAGEARKDAIEQQYLNTDNALTQQQVAGKLGQSYNVAQAASQASAGAAGIIGSILDKTKP